jgi:trigger factor
VQINLQNKENLNATITIRIEKGDYSGKVENALKKYQKNARIPGFRPGKVPFAMIEKMYGTSAKVEEINNLASSSLMNYLKENKIGVLGQPIMTADESAPIDWEKQGDFEFSFDIGLEPKFDLNINESDEFTLYKIQADEEAIQKEMDKIRRDHALAVDVETAGEKDVIYAEATELDNDGNELEGGAKSQVSLVPEMIKNEELQKRLTGLKKDAEITVDIFELFNDNPQVISSSLNVPKEGVNDLNRNFRIKATEIKSYEPAELNQELFDKVWGKDVVKSEEEFKAKLKSDIEAYYDSESFRKLDHDIHHYLIDQHTFALPDEFLKRWLVETHKEHYNEGNIDRKYASEASVLRNSLIQDKLAEKFAIEVTQEDIKQEAVQYTLGMFRQYGIPNAAQETVAKIATDYLKDKKLVERFHHTSLHRKIYEALRTFFTMKTVDISLKDFADMVQQHQHEHHSHEEHDHEEAHEHSHDH